MARKSHEIRNREQRERQQRLRDADRKAKRPNRDDIARTALFMIVSAMAARQAEAELDELAAKYLTGEWPFRRKVHLGEADSAELEG